MSIRMSGLTSGMDTESIVKELMSAQRLKSTKIENKRTKLEWKQEKWKDLNTKIYSFYTGSLSKLKMEGSFNTAKTSSSDESKIEVTSSGNTPEGNHSISVKAVASAQMVTGAVLSTGKAIDYDTKLSDIGISTASGSSITINSGTKQNTFKVVDGATVGDFVNTLQETGLNASYDSVQKRFFISSKEAGVANAFSIMPSAGVDLSKLGLSQIATLKQVGGSVKVSADSNVNIVTPSDAKIVLDGAEIVSSSNTIAVNGLTLTVKGVTEGANTEVTTDDKPVNLTVSRDTKAAYDMVKDFVKSYNELLKGMNEAYYADTAKGYEPLTDDQKEAMSEDQEKQWEGKIKTSLLRRDTTLGAITSSMRNIFGKSVTYDGKNYSLASFGITASDYTEKGLLHIAGDSEDSKSAISEDKLTKALTENPEAVMKTLSQMAKELYSDMTDRMKSTTLRSALTFYNDKEMKKEVSAYKTEISTMEDKLADMESRYYKQFTAMEKAMAKMNSQSSNITSMLGGSQN